MGSFLRGEFSVGYRKVIEPNWYEENQVTIPNRGW